MFESQQIDDFVDILRSEQCKSMKIFWISSRAFPIPKCLQESALIQPRNIHSTFGGDTIHFFIRLLTQCVSVVCVHGVEGVGEVDTNG